MTPRERDCSFTHTHGVQPSCGGTPHMASLPALVRINTRRTPPYRRRYIPDAEHSQHPVFALHNSACAIPTCSLTNLSHRPTCSDCITGGVVLTGGSDRDIRFPSLSACNSLTGRRVRCSQSGVRWF